MANLRYTVFCDESSDKGAFFSNFYGGVVIASQRRQAIEASLRAKKDELNLMKEVKWTKITERYQDKYIDFIRYYFSLIESGGIKVRIMFTQNIHKPVGLTSDQVDNKYFLLYYQTIKHVFGFAHCNVDNISNVYVTVLLDQIPDSSDKIIKFKNFIHSIQTAELFVGSKVFIPFDEITDVDSRDNAAPYRSEGGGKRRGPCRCPGRDQRRHRPFARAGQLGAAPTPAWADPPSAGNAGRQSASVPHAVARRP